MFLRGKPLQKDFQNQRRSHGIDRFLALLAEHAVFRQNPVRIDGRPAFVNQRDRQTGARLEQRCKPAAFFPLQADGAVHIDRQADGNGGDVFFMEQGGKLFRQKAFVFFRDDGRRARPLRWWQIRHGAG